MNWKTQTKVRFSLCLSLSLALFLCVSLCSFSFCLSDYTLASLLCACLLHFNFLCRLFFSSFHQILVTKYTWPNTVRSYLPHWLNSNWGFWTSNPNSQERKILVWPFVAIWFWSLGHGVLGHQDFTISFSSLLYFH